MEEFSEAEVQKFKSVAEALRTDSRTIMPIMEHSAVMDAQLPDLDERERYLKWSSAVADAKPKIRDDPGMTAEEFMREVDSVNLLPGKPSDRLITFMQKNYQNPIAIGFESDIIYRLVLSPFELLPHQKTFQDASGRSLLSPSFLGINTTAQPQEPTPTNLQKPNPSEISACNAESDDANRPGFVFLQLGSLEYNWLEDGEQGWPADDDEDDEDEFFWLPTNFSLVARVGPDGKADGIYAVYNVFQEDIHLGGKRHLVSPRDTRWGTPPTAWDKYEQFFCARVGNRLSEFGKRHHMVWTDKFRDRTTELDRVFLSPTEDRLEFGKHLQMVSGENRLDFGKDNPMVKAIDPKHAIGFWQAPSSDGTGGWDQAAYRVGQNLPRATVS
jgi:hypothetical protein